MALREKINDGLDGLLRSFERSRRKADFVEWLRSEGFQGSDEQILKDHAWLMLPKGATEAPEPEPDKRGRR